VDADTATHSSYMHVDIQEHFTPLWKCSLMTVHDQVNQMRDYLRIAKSGNTVLRRIYVVTIDTLQWGTLQSEYDHL